MVHNKNVFKSYLVSWEALCNNPSLVFDERMVIMTNQRLYPGRVALPLILSTLAFKKPLSGETLAKLAMNDPLQKLFSNAEEKVEEDTEESDEENGVNEEHISQYYDEFKPMDLSYESFSSGLPSSSNSNVGPPWNANVAITSTFRNQSEEKPLNEKSSVPNTEITGVEGGDSDLLKPDENESYTWLSTFWSNGNQKRKGRKRKRHPASKSGAVKR